MVELTEGKKKQKAGDKLMKKTMEKEMLLNGMQEGRVTRSTKKKRVKEEEEEQSVQKGNKSNVKVKLEFEVREAEAGDTTLKNSFEKKAKKKAVAGTRVLRTRASKAFKEEGNEVADENPKVLKEELNGDGVESPKKRKKVKKEGIASPKVFRAEGNEDCFEHPKLIKEEVNEDGVESSEMCKEKINIVGVESPNKKKKVEKEGIGSPILFKDINENGVEYPQVVKEADNAVESPKERKRAKKDGVESPKVFKAEVNEDGVEHHKVFKEVNEDGVESPKKRKKAKRESIGSPKVFKEVVSEDVLGKKAKEDGAKSPKDQGKNITQNGSASPNVQRVNKTKKKRRSSAGIENGNARDIQEGSGVTGSSSSSTRDSQGGSDVTTSSSLQETGSVKNNEAPEDDAQNRNGESKDGNQSGEDGMAQYKNLWIRSKDVKKLKRLKASLKAQGLHKSEITSRCLTKARQYRIKIVAKMVDDLKRKYGEAPKAGTGFTFQENDLMTEFGGFWVCKVDVPELIACSKRKTEEILAARCDGDSDNTSDLTKAEQQVLLQMMQEEKEEAHLRLRVEIMRAKIQARSQAGREEPGVSKQDNLKENKNPPENNLEHFENDPSVVKYRGYYVKREDVPELERHKDQMVIAGLLCKQWSAQIKVLSAERQSVLIREREACTATKKKRKEPEPSLEEIAPELHHFSKHEMGEFLKLLGRDAAAGNRRLEDLYSEPLKEGEPDALLVGELVEAGVVNDAQEFTGRFESTAERYKREQVRMKHRLERAAREGVAAPSFSWCKKANSFLQAFLTAGESLSSMGHPANSTLDQQHLVHVPNKNQRRSLNSSISSGQTETTQTSEEPSEEEREAGGRGEPAGSPSPPKKAGQEARKDRGSITAGKANSGDELHNLEMISSEDDLDNFGKLINSEDTLDHLGMVMESEDSVSEFGEYVTSQLRLLPPAWSAVLKSKIEEAIRKVSIKSMSG